MPPDYTPLTHIPSDPTPPIAVVPRAAPRVPRRVWPKILFTIIIFLIIAGGGALGYGYWKKIGPFSQPPYDPEHFLADLLENISKINSGNYHLSLEIKPAARETDAVPLPDLPEFDDRQNERWRSVPAEFQLYAEVNGLFDHQNADTRSQIKGDLAGGDFNFSLNLEFVKKAQDFYVRVNKLPTLFFFDLSTIKSQWIKITTSDLTSTSTRIAFLPPPAEITEKIKQNQEKFKRDLTRVLQIADEEKVVTAKINRQKEKIDNLSSYRYDLTLNRIQLIKFYERLMNEIPTLNLNRATLEYLRGPDFEKISDYLAQNSRFSFWIEADSGWPLQETYYLRFIPSAEVKQLKDKQINLTLSLKLTEINQPITVTAPTSYQTLTEILNSYRATSTESL